MNDWTALFDDVKAKGQFGSDAQLADSLGLSRAQISAWRTGKSDLGTLTKLKLLDVLGHADLRAAVLSLLPERNREQSIEQHLALVERVARGALPEPQDEPEVAPELIQQNHLLAALPSEDRERLAPHLSPVKLPLGHTLYETGERLSHVYLPTTAVVSMLHVMENGASAEIAVVGNDGLLGVALFMGGETMPSRAIVQSAGNALRLSSETVRREFALGGAVQRLFLRYTQALITQMAQTAVCNRHHTVAQQFCRWLLLTLDRLQTNEIRMTQELIANMLGVRRSGVAEVASKLQREAVIHYRHGVIEVLDRRSLEHHACECYGVVKHECDRLFESLEASD
ncbi:Crp/Fnr family transcriptional regulator [Paraburkholderia sp. DHOC27]|uniref:Crp/Fnr family transcriptional regulator n=1 Tax=Paraburkholderia sp. DHOC27 TaxID=2303330 RepID=UPI000E3CF9A9|nr:Crp/Fnr family transcriptional regulator [Paraburkholderia sp. DHOC27]RFU45952.1 Crp/Fnr family transcriptional regulator [Paraburkholderia sp. DHOC27]